ncbi:hypothetical protein LEP1GSC043_2738, partial [Leptospira weilii str. Ecochallenge]
FSEFFILFFYSLLRSYFRFLFFVSHFHPIHRPLVDRLMTLCLSFQMEKAKKHLNYKRFILL